MYIQGDIYPINGHDTGAVVKAITSSKLTTPILSLFHVNCSSDTCPDSKSPEGSHDADITFNDTLIIRDGMYVGDSGWPSTIKSLRAGMVTKIFASFGGYGVPDFARIGKLIAKYGTGTDSPLYKNFVCLMKTLNIDGIDFDNEDYYDQKTIVSFAYMLLGLGLEVTFCPYCNQSFWSGCIEALTAQQVSWLNLQCYAGGKGNNPGDWTDMGVPVVAGIGANCCCPETNCSPAQTRELFSLWTTGKGSVSSTCWEGSTSAPVDLAGGFIWVYSDVADELDDYVNAMASGLE